MMMSSMIASSLPLQPVLVTNVNSASDSILCMQALLGEHVHWVENVQFAASLQYLLVVLKRHVTRQQLETIEPDFVAMHAAVKPGDLTGIIVTCQGTQKTCVQQPLMLPFQ